MRGPLHKFLRVVTHVDSHQIRKAQLDSQAKQRPRGGSGGASGAAAGLDARFLVDDADVMRVTVELPLMYESGQLVEFDVHGRLFIFYPPKHALPRAPLQVKVPTAAASGGDRRGGRDGGGERAPPPNPLGGGGAKKPGKSSGNPFDAPTGV